MSKFLTQQEISHKLLGFSLTTETDDYLTKGQVVSQYSNEDYDETKLNNVKGDNYFVTDDDIVQSPRYALQVIFADSHVKSVKISVLGKGPIRPTSDNTSDDNDVSPSSLSGGTIIDDPISGGDVLVGNFIKRGKNRTITKTSTVYIPAGASVDFSSTYDDGYERDGIVDAILSMNSDKTVQFASKESTKHNHTYSGTVHVTFNKHNTKDTLSYQVYHNYNNSTCTIQDGNIDGTSATITTPTYEKNKIGTNILFVSNNASSPDDQFLPTSRTYLMRVDASRNVTATAFQSADPSTEVSQMGPTLGLKDIQSGWSVDITIY